MFTPSILRSPIIDGSIIEFVFPLDHLNSIIILYLLIIIKRLLLSAVIFNNNNFPRWIRRFCTNRGDTFVQIISIVFVGDQNRNQGFTYNLILNLVSGRQYRVQNFPRQPNPGQVF